MNEMGNQVSFMADEAWAFCTAHDHQRSLSWCSALLRSSHMTLFVVNHGHADIAYFILSVDIKFIPATL